MCYFLLYRPANVFDAKVIRAQRNILCITKNFKYLLRVALTHTHSHWTKLEWNVKSSKIFCVIVHYTNIIRFSLMLLCIHIPIPHFAFDYCRLLASFNIQQILIEVSGQNVYKCATKTESILPPTKHNTHTHTHRHLKHLIFQ